MTRKPLGVLNDYLKEQKDIYELDLELVCPTPNSYIYKFEGVVNLIEEGKVVRRVPIELENTCWGNSVVCKGVTLGIVIYNGDDSKAKMNGGPPEIKRSLLTDELNNYSKVLFACMLGSGLMLLSMKGFSENWVIQLFRYVLLLSSILPISLKVTHDLSKIFYATRIQRDRDMPGCVARNSGVCEDLGRIEYILSDKTGTLTKNVMIMKEVFIPTIGVLSSAKLISAFNGDKNIGTPQIVDFYTCMLVCHAVYPTKAEDGERGLESSSPDEIAFIEIMEKAGFLLQEKKDDFSSFKDLNNQIKKYQLIYTFPFTSERKRMGIICKAVGDKNYTFFLKGADSIMEAKLQNGSRATMMSQVEEFSKVGLRTLVLSKREVEADEFGEWRKKYEEACASLKDRNQKIESCYEALERNMAFVGVYSIKSR